jgi:hypothetical protein
MVIIEIQGLQNKHFIASRAFYESKIKTRLRTPSRVLYFLL